MENTPVFTWLPPKMLTTMAFEDTPAIPRRMRGRTNSQQRKHVGRVFLCVRRDLLDRCTVSIRGIAPSPCPLEYLHHEIRCK
jgi:hypothetical protein